MTHGVYVTGTDTGIGKTHAAVALLHALRAHGVRAVGMKPVASGCASTPAGWRNSDALALLAASGSPLADPEHAPAPGADAYATFNPYALPLPTAPEIAAQAAGIDIALPRIAECFARLCGDADFVVVEGVGGWAAPLSATLDQVHLVRELALPVIVVVGLRLGCISHARLTVEALRHDHIELRGWIGSAVDPGFSHRDETLAILRRRLAPVACLGVLPHDPTHRAAPALDIKSLL